MSPGETKQSFEHLVYLLRVGLIMLICLFIIIIALGYYNDRVSCDRSNEIRGPLRHLAVTESEAGKLARANSGSEHGAKERADRQLAMNRATDAKALDAKLLNCSAPIPGV